jgi:WD40 repeat protein
MIKDMVTCSKCGLELPPGSPEGVCPNCLLNFAVAEGRTILEEEPGVREVTDLPRAFGDYELLEEIARGGMGIVYKARQRSLDRTVAVKMILAGPLATRQFIQRFRSEAGAAAALHHPNIVAIHDVGVHDGQHFFSMDYVEGQDLAHLVGHRPLAPRKAAEYVKVIAEAIHYAHNQGILHRDLKPSNVLVDAATDQPRVTDFGLARRLDSESSLTVTGQLLGSPAFMPPEQASPDRGKVGRYTDVYALGGVLYHLLTARPPFQGESLPSVITQVLETEPIPPRLLNPAVPKDLETICLKCLEKEPGRRYATARELAEDIGRFLKNLPVHARPVGRTERFWRWCRREPALASLGGVALGLLCVVAIGAPIAALRINAARRQAELRAYTSDMNIVLQAWEDGNLRRAQARLRGHIPKPGQPDLRAFEWRYLWNLCQDESGLSFTNFPSGVKLVAAPDRKSIAAASERTIHLIDSVNNRELETLVVPANADDDVTALAFSPADANVLATASGRTLNLWSLADRRVSATITLLNSAAVVALSPDGKLLAAGSGHKQTIELWRLEDRALVWTNATPTQVFALLFARDGRSLISGGGDVCNPVAWDMASGLSSRFPAERQGWINAMAISPDGQVLATCSTDSAIILWDLARRQLVTRLIPPSAGSADAAAFSADGRWLISGYADSTVRLWDITRGFQQTIYRGHKYGVTGSTFSPDGSSILTSGNDGTVKVWHIGAHAPEQILATNESWAAFVRFSPDGKFLASSAVAQGGLAVWDVATRQPIAKLTRPSSNTEPTAVFSPDGKILAHVVGERIKLWDGRTFAPKGELTNGFDAISLSFSPDNRTVAAAGLAMWDLHGITNRLAFWDLTSGRKINKLKAAAPLAVIVSFSHDGRILAIGYLNGEVRLWDYESERLLAEFRDQHSRIWSLAFSPDDSLLVAGGDEGAVVSYDVRARRLSRPVIPTSTWILGLAFTPDGKTLASAEGDGTIKLWNVATGEIALTLKGHIGAASYVAFSPDGSLLASCGADGTVRLWPAAPPNQVPH